VVVLVELMLLLQEVTFLLLLNDGDAAPEVVDTAILLNVTELAFGSLLQELA